MLQQKYSITAKDMNMTLAVSEIKCIIAAK